MLMGTCDHVSGLTKEETFMRHVLTFSATSASTRLFLLFALLALVLGGAPPTLAQTDGQVDLTLGSGIANTNQVTGSSNDKIANTAHTKSLGMSSDLSNKGGELRGQHGRDIAMGRQDIRQDVRDTRGDLRGLNTDLKDVRQDVAKLNADLAAKADATTIAA